MLLFLLHFISSLELRGWLVILGLCNSRTFFLPGFCDAMEGTQWIHIYAYIYNVCLIHTHERFEYAPASCKFHTFVCLWCSLFLELFHCLSFCFEFTHDWYSDSSNLLPFIFLMTWLEDTNKIHKYPYTNIVDKKVNTFFNKKKKSFLTNFVQLNSNTPIHKVVDRKKNCRIFSVNI